MPPTLSLIQIMERFSTDEAARAYLEAIRWPNGPACPHCGCYEHIASIRPNPSAKVRAGLYECGDCKRQFTVTVGTIFESSKVPLRKWLAAWYLLCSSKKGVSALQLQRQLELGSYRTAWFMMHRIRYALRNSVFSGKLGSGSRRVVEADETWIGGKVRGKGRAYKGNKTAVMSTIERGGRVRSQVVGTVTADNLSVVLRSQVDERAILYTDENAAYTKVGAKFQAHETVNHSRKEYARGPVHTNTAEGYFANLKRGLNGIYHHVGVPYLNQYLAEFDFRYNTRRLNDGDRTMAALQHAEGKRLMLARPSMG